MKAKQEKPLPTFRPVKQHTKPSEPVDPLKIEEPLMTNEPVVKQEQKTNEKFTYMCGVCDKLCEEEDEMMCHMREAHDDDNSELDQVRYECSICDRSYALKLSLIKHLARHKKRTTQTPGEEKLLAKSKVRLNLAMGSVYQCDICKKVLCNRQACLRHIRVHNNERPITCEQCGKSYRVEEDLKRHIDDVHKKIKRYPCDLCEKFFAAKGTRDAHRRIHTGEKPFECTECGKFFRSVNLLGIHKRIHRDYRPHKCNSCEKAFRSKQKLEAHEAIHTGIRPYPCDVCNKMFAAKGEATRHRSVHFSDKPFLCSECGLAFRLNRYLKTHIKTKHKDNAEILLKSLTERE